MARELHVVVGVGTTMHPWEYRMRFFGEDEGTARKHAEDLGKPMQGAMGA